MSSRPSFSLTLSLLVAVFLVQLGMNTAAFAEVRRGEPPPAAGLTGKLNLAEKKLIDDLIRKANSTESGKEYKPTEAEENVLKKLKEAREKLTDERDIEAFRNFFGGHLTPGGQSALNAGSGRRFSGIVEVPSLSISGGSNLVSSVQTGGQSSTGYIAPPVVRPPLPVSKVARTGANREANRGERRAEREKVDAQYPAAEAQKRKESRAKTEEAMTRVEVADKGSKLSPTAAEKLRQARMSHAANVGEGNLGVEAIDGLNTILGKPEGGNFPPGSERAVAGAAYVADQIDSSLSRLLTSSPESLRARAKALETEAKAVGAADPTRAERLRAEATVAESLAGRLDGKDSKPFADALADMKRSPATAGALESLKTVQERIDQINARLTDGKPMDEAERLKLEKEMTELVEERLLATDRLFAGLVKLIETADTKVAPGETLSPKQKLQKTLGQLDLMREQAYADVLVSLEGRLMKILAREKGMDFDKLNDTQKKPFQEDAYNTICGDGKNGKKGCRLGFPGRAVAKSTASGAKGYCAVPVAGRAPGAPVTVNTH